MQPKNLLIALLISISIFSCKDDKEEKTDVVPLQSFVEPIEIKEFGFNLNDYIVKRDTIKKGDSFLGPFSFKIRDPSYIVSSPPIPEPTLTPILSFSLSSIS